MRKVLLLLLVPVVFFACEEEPELEDQCSNGVNATLVAENHTESICGGHYIFTTSEQDTIRVKYGETLREFFLYNEIEESDFPISVKLSVTDLPEDDACSDYLKEASCIQYYWLPD